MDGGKNFTNTVRAGIVANMVFIYAAIYGDLYKYIICMQINRRQRKYNHEIHFESQLLVLLKLKMYTVTVLLCQSSKHVIETWPIQRVVKHKSGHHFNC